MTVTFCHFFWRKILFTHKYWFNNKNFNNSIVFDKSNTIHDPELNSVRHLVYLDYWSIIYREKNLIFLTMFSYLFVFIAWKIFCSPKRYKYTVSEFIVYLRLACQTCSSRTTCGSVYFIFDPRDAFRYMFVTINIVSRPFKRNKWKMIQTSFLFIKFIFWTLLKNILWYLL